MKYWIGVLLLVVGSWAAQAQTFEGIIEMRQETGEGLNYTLKWYIKGGRLAYELINQEEHIRFVPRPASRSMLMVAGETKTTIPVGEITGVAHQQLQGAALETNGSGRCPYFGDVQQWRIATPQVEAVLQVTTDVGVNFSHYRDFFKGDYTLSALAASGQAGFPIKSLTLDRQGNLLSKTTITKVTRMTVSEAYFE